MKKSLFTMLLMAGVLASILVMSRHASAATLLAYDGDNNSLYSIDTATAIATLIGTDYASGDISEIELSAGGVVYAADTDDNTLLHTIDPSTGSVTGTITMTFPMGGDVLTALEFVGSTLYAGFTTEDSGGPTFLTTVDIGTGIVSTVGATGVSSPLGGLAYDVATSVMYGISAGGSSAELFTIDLSTGAATSVGLVTIGGTSFGGTTALEFGPDGVLYALPNNNSSITGHLLSIDPLTGAATDLGFTGAESLNALTAGTMSQVVAHFVANPTTGFPPLTVTFTDQSLGNVTSWSWDFGDGSTSTMQNPSHTYTDPGTYTVSLTVTGPDGLDIETKSDYIKVSYVGDINDDGYVDLGDAVLALQVMSGTHQPALSTRKRMSMETTRSD
jgi:hypothetical protein